MNRDLLMMLVFLVLLEGLYIAFFGLTAGLALLCGIALIFYVRIRYL